MALSTSKGKQKIVDSAESDQQEFFVSTESESVNRTICGICLGEDGKATRGWIDSCKHYFCFVCIMEWARVESRCPTCKQRFRTIRRPAKAGIFDDERVVHVPTRDQVYHYHENATAGAEDPYAEVVCSKCLGPEDENLLLLCDLCDSAAHTYCVGLGVTVPEGDWFCHDCSVLRNNSSDGKPIEGFDESGIFDSRIAQENLYDMHQNGTIGTSSIHGRHEHTIFVNESCSSFSEEVMVEAQPARTLRDCRNLRDHIKTLRENWNALQSGVLDFSFNLLHSNTENMSGHQNDRLANLCNSGQGCSTSSRCMQNAGEKSSNHILNDRTSEDVDRAWRMFEVAKMAESACTDNWKHVYDKRKANLNGRPKIVRCDASTKKPIRTSLRENLSSADYRLDQVHKKNKIDHSKKQQPELKLPLEEKALKPSGAGVCKRWKPSQEGYVKPDDGVITHSPSGAYNMPSTVGPVDRPTARMLEMKDVMDKKSKGLLHSHSNAKGEIQSLVKLNLKFVIKATHLGTDRYKEIARLHAHNFGGMWPRAFSILCTSFPKCDMQASKAITSLAARVYSDAWLLQRVLLQPCKNSGEYSGSRKFLRLPRLFVPHKIASTPIMSSS